MARDADAGEYTTFRGAIGQHARQPEGHGGEDHLPRGGAESVYKNNYLDPAAADPDGASRADTDPQDVTYDFRGEQARAAHDD